MTKETSAIKKYLAYLPLRLAYLKIYGVQPTHNEYKYYLELCKSIKEYGKKHKVFFYFITSKINYKKFKAFHRVSERTGYRILAKQRKEFLEFLTQKEAELSKKYPFENGLDIKELQE